MAVVADDNVKYEDLMPVSSRISWGAIFAGAVIAMAVYLVLTLLGSAIGLTVNDNVNGTAFTVGAAIWAVFTAVASLFVGGYVTSQIVVGENKAEGAIHGIIMWGVVLFLTLWMVGAGMRTGFNAMWGIASFTTQAVNTADVELETAAREAGLTDEQLATMQANLNSAPDEATIERAEKYATAATWYTLLGTVLSIAAAVLGGIVGAGPNFRLLKINLAPASGLHVPGGRTPKPTA